MADAAALVARLRLTHGTGRTRSIEWRVHQLQRLKALVEEREPELMAALHADLGKPTFEAWLGETGYLATEIDNTLKALPGWLKPEKVSSPLAVHPAKARIHREPLGVVLIIGPWNYPIQLVLAPLIGAIAAGNCAVLKPSELAPASAAVMARLVPQYLDRDAIAVVEGGVTETSALLDERFDHIFFTGGGTVGRIVMQAAAKHLTPVTLELGGKSPCIVDRDVDLDVAARRITWGKYFNAGQTCVAPDYILVDESIELALLAKIRDNIREFYGEDPHKSADYARIVNARHHQRLSKLLHDGEVVVGGSADETDRYIAPTVLRRVDEKAPVMADEIFGPILPVLTVRSMDAAIDFVNAREKPLALYVFSKSRATQERIIDRTSSGGACLNDIMYHLAVPELPFGGVGPSGMGAYHGRWGFETFSHRKSVLDKSTVVDPRLRYPPYDDAKLKWARRLV